MPGAKNLNEQKELKVAIKSIPGQGCSRNLCCTDGFRRLGLLEGKKSPATVLTELRGAEVTGDKVSVDNNIITGRGPGLVFDFALELVETIAGAGTRKEVQEGLLL